MGTPIHYSKICFCRLLMYRGVSFARPSFLGTTLFCWLTFRAQYIILLYICSLLLYDHTQYTAIFTYMVGWQHRRLHCTLCQ